MIRYSKKYNKYLKKCNLIVKQIGGINSLNLIKKEDDPLAIYLIDGKEYIYYDYTENEGYYFENIEEEKSLYLTHTDLLKVHLIKKTNPKINGLELYNKPIPIIDPNINVIINEQEQKILSFNNQIQGHINNIKNNIMNGELYTNKLGLTNKYDFYSDPCFKSRIRFENVKQFIDICKLIGTGSQSFVTFRSEKITADQLDTILNNGIGPDIYRKYPIPFSTSFNFEFCENWFDNILIYVITVPKNSYYLILYDNKNNYEQNQYEITLPSGVLVVNNMKKYILKNRKFLILFVDYIFDDNEELFNSINTC